MSTTSYLTSNIYITALLKTISPDRTNDGRMADNKLLSVVNAVLETSRKSAEKDDFRPPRRGHASNLVTRRQQPAPPPGPPPSDVDETSNYVVSDESPGVDDSESRLSLSYEHTAEFH